MMVQMKLLMDSLTHFDQDNIVTSMRRSEYSFNSDQMMYYKCHKVTFRRGVVVVVVVVVVVAVVVVDDDDDDGVDSPNWIKKKTKTICKYLTLRRNELFIKNIWWEYVWEE